MTVAATAIEPEVVHEALDERQFVRTSFPAKAILHTRDGDITCDVDDISLGGVGLVSDRRLTEGTIYPIEVRFQLKDMTLSLEGSVKIVAHRNQTTGAEFTELTPGQRNVLRHMVSAYLAGDLVESNGILTVMQRENHIRQRKQKADNSRSVGERIKALLGTLVYLAAALVVMAILLHQLYLFFFRTEALTAVVQGEAFQITMPENGMVSFLLPPGQKTVKTGDPVAAVSTRLMASLNTPADLAALEQLSDDGTRTLLGRSMIETVISSPCDCEVFYTSAPRDRYGYKDEDLVHLLPTGSPLHVTAQFPFESLNRIRGDERVELSVFGIDGVLDGRITGSALDPETGNLRLTILPDQKLPLSAYQRPVQVRVYKPLPGLADLSGLPSPAGLEG